MPHGDLGALDQASEVVHRTMPPTPQIQWPLLGERVGAELWVKHENHTPIGSFKIRGGLVYVDRLRKEHPQVRGVIAATRGNFGQGIGLAARREGIRAVVVVPRGNSVEKNTAMRALGAELIEHGRDFQEAYEYTLRRATEDDLHFVPSFHRWLWYGTATYGLELLRAVADLDVIYVPIGLGSGICGVIAARDALRSRAKVVGVVAENADAQARSFHAGRAVATDSATTIADGMACRVPDDDAVQIIRRGAERIATVSESEIRDAMRIYFTDTHNVAEGAGAAPLAAAIKDRDALRGKKVAVVLSGGNVDASVYTAVLRNTT